MTRKPYFGVHVTPDLDSDLLADVPLIQCGDDGVVRLMYRGGQPDINLESVHLVHEVIMLQQWPVAVVTTDHAVILVPKNAVPVKPEEPDSVQAPAAPPSHAGDEAYAFCNLAELANTINTRFGAQVGAERALGTAEDVYTLVSFVGVELAARFPLYGAITHFFEDEHKGVYGLGCLLAIRMLMDAPDLLPLALERAYADLRGGLVGKSH